MKSSKDLQELLRQIDGKNYPNYKQIKGEWRFPHFHFLVDHVQGDAFAMPSKFRIFITHEQIQTPSFSLSNKIRRVALRDFLTRRFHRLAKAESSLKGTGKGGLITIDQPGQQILETSSCLAHDDHIELRFTIGLPANGRRILGYDAEQILIRSLPNIVNQSLKFHFIDLQIFEQHVLSYEDAESIRGQISKMKLVAFVANGSQLARASGISDTPLTGGIPFQSPQEFAVTIDRPNFGPITGMGLPQGISLIVGGGYHGKSTLLRAIERGVYNHVPGDGREWVISDAHAVKIRAEDGRCVTGADISPFIGNLPGDKKTNYFNSDNASGSTSQAANIMEALELGATSLLLDEDTSATNFMIRDHRMQLLIAKEKEPITPFVDRIRQIFDNLGVSVILVMGGSGDYFDKADQVIAMENYQPIDVTKHAKAIAEKYQTNRENEAKKPFAIGSSRRIHPRSFSGKKGKKELYIRCRKTDDLTYGIHSIDTYYVEQLVHTSQLRAIGYAMHHLESYLDRNRTLKELVLIVEKILADKGIESLPLNPEGDLACFRRFELAACINRCRELRTAPPIPDIINENV